MQGLERVPRQEADRIWERLTKLNTRLNQVLEKARPDYWGQDHDVMNLVMEATRQVLGTTRADMISRTKVRAITDARRLFVGLCREKGVSNASIASLLHLHHSTGIHYHRSHKALLEVDRAYRATYEQVVHKLKILYASPF